MSKKQHRLNLIVLFLSLLFAKQGLSFGIGLNVPVLGTGFVTITNTSYGQNNSDISYGGGLGITFDTRLAKNGIFNYRLNISVTNLNFNNAEYYYDFHDDSYFYIWNENYKYKDAKLYTLDNTFGFGIIRNHFMRLWAGFQVRLGALSYSDEFIELTEICFGSAPVLGINFNFGRVYTAGLDLGYRYSAYAGRKTHIEDPLNSGTKDVSMRESTVFINLSIFFRINDVFE